MTTPLRIAVLGMAHDHLWDNLPDLLACERGDLVAGADVNPKLRELFRERTGCDGLFEDYAELLDEVSPDAVYAYGATAEHAGVVELCAERGIHAMVEKPMAATLEQADRMIAAAQTAGVCLMVNWPTAWSPVWERAGELVRAGDIGRLWQITWRGGHSGPELLGCSPEFCQFLFDKELNGSGAFTDYGGYGASLCVLLMEGSPNSVAAMAGRLVKTQLPVEDNGIVLLRYPQAICRLEMTWSEAVPHQPPHDTVLYGTDGTAVIGRDLTVHTRGEPSGQTLDCPPLPQGRGNASEYFLECIAEGREPEGQTNPMVSRAAQEIVEAGLRAATTGMEIALPLEDHLFR